MRIRRRHEAGRNIPESWLIETTSRIALANPIHNCHQLNLVLLQLRDRREYLGGHVLHLRLKHVHVVQRLPQGHGCADGLR